MFTLPEIDFSKFDINALRNIPKNVKVPTNILNNIPKSITVPNVREAAYMTVGLGVVAAEMIQARRQQLSDLVTETITERVTQVREMIRTAV